MAVKMLLDAEGTPVTPEKNNRPKFNVHKTFSFTGKFQDKAEFTNYDKFPENIFDKDDAGKEIYSGIIYKRINSDGEEIKDISEDGFLKLHEGPLSMDKILEIKHESSRIVSIVSDYIPVNYKHIKTKTENKNMEVNVGEDPVETFKLKRFYKPIDGVELNDLTEIDINNISMIFVYDDEDIEAGQCHDVDEEAVILINSKKMNFAALEQKVVKRFTQMSQKDFFKKFK